ncbi:MAG: M20 family metallopeptidase [Acidobacteriota bacterium]
MDSLQLQVNRQELVQLLSDLVSINSVNPVFGGTSGGEERLSRYIEDFYRKQGIDCERQEVLPNRPNVIGKVPGRDPSRRLLFDAHLDTVSEEGMTIEAFHPRLAEGRLYGRGACDTKGGMAAMIYALALLRQSGVQPAGDVWVATTVDEEYGFHGIRKLAASGVQALGAVVAEPTELKITTCHKGILRWKVRTFGRAAHSSRPELGINAISKMARLISRIETRLQPRYASRRDPLLGTPTFNIGVIEGGIQLNLVPSVCEAQIERRLLPGETKDSVYEEFREVFEELAGEDTSFQAEMDEPFLEDPYLQTAAAAAIVRRTQQVCQQTLGQSELAGVPYGTNASKLAGVGIPSLVFGPGSIDQAHTACEYVEIEQVVKAAQVYLGLMIQS